MNFFQVVFNDCSMQGELHLLLVENSVAEYRELDLEVKPVP